MKHLNDVLRALTVSVGALASCVYSSFTHANDDYVSREQRPVTRSWGLAHPLTGPDFRAELAYDDFDTADAISLSAQGELPIRDLSTDSGLLLRMSGIGDAGLIRLDSPAGSDTNNFIRGGVRLASAIPGAKGLLAGADLNLAYSRAGSESDIDLFTTLSVRYQMPKATIGQAMDLYSALRIGGDTLFDNGFLLGVALPLVNRMVAGLEVSSYNDSLSGYFGLPISNTLRLTTSVGVADNVDAFIMAQLGVALD